MIYFLIQSKINKQNLFARITKPKEKKQRKSKLLQTFSLQDTLPAHYKLCIFNIMLVLFLYSIVVYLEFIIDKGLIADDSYFRSKEVTTILIPFIVQNSLLFALTFIAIVYFITAYCFGQNEVIYKFDTFLIGQWLVITGLTIPMSPIYIVCFFVSIEPIQNIQNEFPMLFILIIVLLILSFFDFIFCAWIIIHVLTLQILYKTGLKKRDYDPSPPMQLINDNKRDVEIQESVIKSQTSNSIV